MSQLPKLKIRRLYAVQMEYPDGGESTISMQLTFGEAEKRIVELEKAGLGVRDCCGLLEIPNGNENQSTKG